LHARFFPTSPGSIDFPQLAADGIRCAQPAIGRPGQDGECPFSATGPSQTDDTTLRGRSKVNSKNLKFRTQSRSQIVQLIRRGFTVHPPVEEERVRLSSDVSSRVRQFDALEARWRPSGKSAMRTEATAAADSANEGLSSRITTLATELQTITNGPTRIGHTAETESKVAILNTRSPS